MGQQSSKSSIETKVIFQRVGAEGMSQRTDACSSPASVVRIQKKATSQSACRQCSAREPEKPTPHSWSQSRCDTGGLVYVMDNPTGGVWVKPGEKWTRSWQKKTKSRDEIWTNSSMVLSLTPRDWMQLFGLSAVASSGQRRFAEVLLAHLQCFVDTEVDFQSCPRCGKEGWTERCNLLI